MILNTGSRTDIPAYYSDWFYNRIKEGYVLVRNPYNPLQVTKYILAPEVVDVIVFCTKNPEPMLDRLELLSEFEMFWFVTITPYGKEIEPYVPEKERVTSSFRKLAQLVGRDRVSWRYDPIFITEKYSVDEHIRSFERLAERLVGATGQCVVSFVDLYEKTKKNFPGVRKVTAQEQEYLIEAFGEIAGEHHLQIHLCCEDSRLVRKNVDADGCMSKEVLERAIGWKLDVPNKRTARAECNCLLGADIGVYNTCGHGCLYCYANYDRQTVTANRKAHDANSPFLVGSLRNDDVIKEAEQKTWKNGQMSIFDMMTAKDMLEKRF
ncbi:MAG: DUF1848 domain-containing protein [Lachnospiraceae bacterium]|nr:DUF1848 domain-containing protein [Lachnospiraceae bacterium]